MQAQQPARAQQSATSLARYAPQRPDGADPFNGHASRDYCNAFWGPGDSGPNVLFARLRGAARTTDELRNFWHERTNIEQEYAQKLAKLAKVPVGVDEIGELRQSLTVLRKETEMQAATHLELANRMRKYLEEQTAEFHMKQINHRRTSQANLEKKLKARLNQETYVARAREKYEADLQRIEAYTQQLSLLSGREADRVETRLKRTRETAQANEKDFFSFTKTLLELLTEWELEWKKFCDSCQDLEEDRLEFMKDNLWLYANEVSTLCVSDDQSCERIREALDQFEPERDVYTFADLYGSGNEMPTAPTDAPLDLHEPPLPEPKLANFERSSHRVPREYAADDTLVQQQLAEPPVPLPQANGSHDAEDFGNTRAESQPTASSPVIPAQSVPPSSSTLRTEALSSTAANNTTATSSRPVSQAPSTAPRRMNSVRQSPLPIPQASTNEPVPDSVETGNQTRVLFYVKALYDYQATIDEEFDFQAGDIIAVLAAPEDGWWSGELLDEERRVEGKHIFPSNFVCLF